MWEDYTELRKQFPNFCLDDKSILEIRILSAHQNQSRLGAIGIRFDVVKSLEEKAADELMGLSGLGLALESYSKVHCELVNFNTNRELEESSIGRKSTAVRTTICSDSSEN
jgi:hypothetical protein